MTKTEMADLVKKNLKIKDDNRDLAISDVIDNVIIYCNLNENCIPSLLEPFVRKKVSDIIKYEEANGTEYHKDIASIKEGDGTITFVTGDSATSEADVLYGLNSADKTRLQAFRRLRGYV